MKNPATASVIVRGAALLFIILITGCGKTPLPVLDLPIAKGDWNDYNRSLRLISDRQTPEERLEFTKAIYELKYQAMAAEGLPAGPEINAAVRAQIEGHTVRDVLVLGHTIKLGRKHDEKQSLQRSIAKNKRLRTREGDEASATFLQSVHVNQAKQLEVVHGEIAALERRIHELAPGHITPSEPAAPDDEVVPPGELEELPQLKQPAPPDKRKSA